jgi:Zn-dependent M28 family amino/carboxypeptidase
MIRRLFLTVTWLTSLVLILLGSCFVVCFAPSAKAEVIRNSTIAEMISKIDQKDIYNTVYTLQNFTTRRFGTSGNAQSAVYLYDRLESIPKLSVEYQSDANNIIATLPGVNPTSNIIYIVGAHYDCGVPDSTFAPGATDDGGGVAIVLELAKIMSQYSYDHTIKFAFWNAEETSDDASLAYAKQAYENKMNISLYFNYDSACYDPNDNLVLDIISNGQSQWASEIATECNTVYNIGFKLTYNVHSCSGDAGSFQMYGYPTIFTHQETHDVQHTVNDTIDKVSTVFAQKNGQLGMAVLAYLAEVRSHTTTPNSAPTPIPSSTTLLTPTSTYNPNSTLTPSPMPTELSEASSAIAAVGVIVITSTVILLFKRQKR